jgi:hypothetical protein
MERRFDMSDFERSLKDHADQFKLIPSKRVWNGIYNNLHPGSKWPSISIAIVFIITLISIGNLNNSPTHSDIISSVTINTKSNNNETLNEIANKISNQKTISEKNNNAQTENVSSINAGSLNLVSKNSFETGRDKVSLKLRENKLEKNYPKPLVLPVIFDKQGQQNMPQQFTKRQENIFSNENPSQENVGSIISNNSTATLPITQNNLLPEKMNSLENDLLVPVSFPLLFEPMQFFSSFNPNIDAVSKQINKADLNSQKGNTAVAQTKKIKRKKNKNVEWTFYATPTIGSVSYNKRRNIPASSSNVSSVIILPNDPSFGLRRTVKLGFESGAEMSYKISKKFKFITGANLSYSGYNNMSNLIHPTFASLNFIGKNSVGYSKSYVTNFGNGQSPNRIPLTNYSFEFSIPVGLKFNIWQNEKIQIDAVSTVDPSVVLKKNAFIISSDGRYYINDPSLVRNVNLAGHVGSYITFSAEKIKWHIGPDIRYQLLSTYKSYYPAHEHFIDYGIRIGISR